MMNNYSSKYAIDESATNQTKQTSTPREENPQPQPSRNPNKSTPSNQINTNISVAQSATYTATVAGPTNYLQVVDTANSQIFGSVESTYTDSGTLLSSDRAKPSACQQANSRQRSSGPTRDVEHISSVSMLRLPSSYPTCHSTASTALDKSQQTRVEIPTSHHLLRPALASPPTVQLLYQSSSSQPGLPATSPPSLQPIHVAQLDRRPGKT
ncbi:Hypothetical protein D9617_1g081810 [Elsinoe fawcettii]|nr:Hypothetical protein D9617_1g081810 [Elsinoe fawcettii]